MLRLEGYSLNVKASKFLLTALLTIGPAALAQDSSVLEFEPRVGAIGSRVLIKTQLSPGAVVRLGSRTVPILREARGASFMVPAGAATSFIEVVRDHRTVSKSAVPFVVSGTSLVATPKLVGLKEAIDVFGYTEPKPEGGQKPETNVRPILKFDDDEVLTIGQSAPARLGPAVELGDASSMAGRSMGPAGFLITARPPRKKAPVPTPAPSE